jgi:hypothetical protein
LKGHKTQMVSWKGALGTWKKNNFQSTPNPQSVNPEYEGMRRVE